MSEEIPGTSAMPASTADVAGVTIVMGCYNHAAYVEGCLLNIHALDYPHVDIIITDDASSDDTQAVVRRVLAEHGWAARTIFHEKNVGICKTHNEALALVRTPYVAYFAADDWMAPERLSVQVPLLEANPTAALAYSDVYYADGESLELASIRAGSDWHGGKHDDLFHDLLPNNWLLTPSVLLRAECVRAVGGFNEDLWFEDWDMWLKLAQRYTFVYSPQPLAYYRIHPGQMSADSGLNTSLRLVKVRLDMYRGFLGVTERGDEWIVPHLYEWACQAWRLGEPGRNVATDMWRHAKRTRQLKPAMNAGWAFLGGRPRR